MVLVYAAQADFLAWTGLTTAPTNIAQLLRSASLAVREATELCFFNADTTGLPIDTPTLQAFNDATCSQAAFLNSEGIDPNAGGVLVAGVLDAVAIGSGRVGFADAAQAALAKTDAMNGICPEARRILADAGLTPSQPWVTG